MTRFEKYKAMTIEDLAEAMFDNDITMAIVCEPQVKAGQCPYSIKDAEDDKIDMTVCKRCFVKYLKGEANDEKAI